MDTGVRELQKQAAIDKLREEFDEVYARGLRDGLLYDVVKKYKFEAMRGLADPLAELLGGVIPCSGFVLVPMPTIGKHIRQRGFDHVMRLVKRLSDATQMSWQKVLARANQTTQVGASAEMRLAQAQGAYKLAKGVKISKEEHYLLVDDVITTGASMVAAARVLREAGARYVSGAALVINVAE